MEIKPGHAAPDFSLADENGIKLKLSDYRGIPVVLYFYPKDDTPGCTQEACNFRDDYSAYLEAGITILGVSPDSPKAHSRFKKKYNLPFTLLSDEDHSVAELYGVWVLKNMYGKKYYGVSRTTFLINQTGIIVKVFEKVKPAQHSKEVLEALREYEQGS